MSLFKQITTARMQLLAAGVLMLTACSRDPQEMLDSGKRYIAERKFSEASIELRNAVNASPESSEAHYQLGLAFAGLGQLADANAEFTKTLGLNPSHVGAQLKAAHLLLLERKFDEARQKAQELLKQDPANLKAQILLGNSYSGLFHLNDSIDELRWAFETEPRRLPAFLDLSVGATNFTRDPEQAENAYKAALASDPASTISQLVLANFYAQSNRAEEAEQQYKAILSASPASRDTQVALGSLYIQTQKLDQAEQIYAQLAAQKPDDVAEQLLLADFYGQANKPAQATAVLEKILNQNPGHVIATKRLANLFLVQEDFTKATEYADRALKNAQNDLEALLIKNRILLAQNRTAEAVAGLQTLVRTRPTLPMGRYLLGIGYLQAQDFPRAEAELLAAIQFDVSFADAYIPLAELKLSAGNASAAIRYARQALAFNSSLSAAHLPLIRSYISLKDYRTAAEEADAYLKKNPGKAAGLHHMGLLEQARGNASQAERNYEAALAADPKYVDSLMSLSFLYMSRNQAQRAIERINQGIAQHPEISSYQTTLAQIYAMQGNTAKGEEAFLRAVASNPADLNQQLRLSDFYLTTGNLAKSAETLQALLAKDAQNVLALKRLGEIYLRQQEYGKAGEVAESILKIKSGDTDALILKGRILLAQNKTSEAVSQLQTAVTSEPTSAVARYNLGLAHLQTGNRQRAESEWTEAVRTAGSFLAPITSLSQLKLENGDNKSAAEYARQALMASPNLPEAQFVLAVATQDPAALRTAAASLDAAVKRSPGDTTNRQRLGFVLLSQQSFSGAEAQFEAILKQNPQSREALAGLVRLYAAQNRPDKAQQRLSGEPLLLADFFVSRKDYGKAEEVLKEGIGKKPQDKETKRRLAELYLGTNQIQKSLGVYEELIKLDSTDATAKRQLAVLYLNQKNPDRARQLADELIAVNSSDAEARVLKARALLAQMKNAEAIAELQGAAKTAPELATARFFLGIAYWQDGKPDQAEIAWSESIRLDPRSSQAHLALAQFRLGLNDPGRAMRHAEDALKVDPNLAEAQILIGDAHLRRNDPRAAAAAFEAVVKKNPAHTLAVKRLGTAYLAQQDFARAEAQFLSALRSEPDSVETLSLLATVYVQQKNPARAISRVNQELAKSPNNPKLHELMGRIYFAQRNYTGAEAEYRKSLALDKNTLSVYGLLAQLFLAQNSVDKAIAEFEGQLKVDSRPVIAHTMLGSLHEMKNASDRAQYHYREALKLDPQGAVAANNLAWLMAESGGNLDEALNLARTANERLPNTPNILDTTGWIYYKKGAFASAEDLFKESIEKDPENAVYHFHLGMTYFQLGNTRAARASLEQAIKLDSAFPGAQDARNTLAKLQ